MKKVHRDMNGILVWENIHLYFLQIFHIHTPILLTLCSTTALAISLYYGIQSVLSSIATSKGYI